MTQHIIRVSSIKTGEVYQFSVDGDSLSDIRQKISTIFNTNERIYLKHNNDEITADDHLQKLFRVGPKPLHLKFGTQSKLIIPISNRKTHAFDAKFIGHVTYPDGYQVGAGQSIIKTWRVRNVGKTVWPRKLKVVCSGPSNRPINIRMANPVIPGQETNISIKITMPETPGIYTGSFRLASGNYITKPFGQDFNLKLEAVPTYDLFNSPFNGLFPDNPWKLSCQVF